MIDFVREHHCQKRRRKYSSTKPCTQKKAWTPIVLFYYRGRRLLDKIQKEEFELNTTAITIMELNFESK
jgi:hypothetical protein